MRVALADGWVDLDEGLVHRGSEASNLTETERALLTYLAERSGQVVERGAPDALAVNDGLYARIKELQEAIEQATDAGVPT